MPALWHFWGVLKDWAGQMGVHIPMGPSHRWSLNMEETQEPHFWATLQELWSVEQQLNELFKVSIESSELSPATHVQREGGCWVPALAGLWGHV